MSPTFLTFYKPLEGNHISLGSHDDIGGAIELQGTLLKTMEKAQEFIGIKLIIEIELTMMTNCHGNNTSEEKDITFCHYHWTMTNIENVVIFLVHVIGKTEIICNHIATAKDDGIICGHSFEILVRCLLTRILYHTFISLSRTFFKNIKVINRDYWNTYGKSD